MKRKVDAISRLLPFLIDALRVRKKSIQFLFICSFVLIGAFSYIANNSFYVAEAHVDEIHTTKFMLNRLNGENEFPLRVPESGRILGFLFHPMALYYMNTKMGGEVSVLKWEYPRDYLKRSVVSNNWNYKKIHSNPNVQDYVFALRTQQVLLVVASFLFVAIALLSFSGFSSALIFLVAGLSSDLIFQQAKFFYNDIQLVIAFNLIVGLLIFPQLHWVKRVVYLPIAFAFGATTKMSMALLAPLVWYKIFNLISANRKSLVFELTLLSFISSIFVYFLFSIGASSWSLLVNEQLANVWHYNTGHGVTQPSGLYQFRQLISSLSNLTLALVGSSILFSFLKFKLFGWSEAIIAGTAIAVLLALCSSHYYMERNIILLELLAILFGSVIIGRTLQNTNISSPFAISAAVVTLLIFGVFNIKRTSIFELDNFESTSSSCSRILSVGEIKFPGANVDELTINTPFRLNDKLKGWRQEVSGYECVYIFRSGQYKQFSNFILPMSHRLAARHGGHFFFKKAVQVVR